MRFSAGFRQTVVHAHGYRGRGLRIPSGTTTSVLTRPDLIMALLERTKPICGSWNFVLTTMTEAAPFVIEFSRRIERSNTRGISRSFVKPPSALPTPSAHVEIALATINGKKAAAEPAAYPRRSAR